jgi:5-methylcytosine-specific restriction endonuclease McrA
MTALSGRGRPWRTLRARVLSEEQVCGLCGGVVDKSLRHPHPGAPQVDHVIPVSVAPELVMVRSNLRLVHRACNLRRGVGRKRRPPEVPAVFGPLSAGSGPSRVWRTWGSW